MFEKEKTYKIQYFGNEQELVFTGKIIEKTETFIKVNTVRNEIIILRLDKIIKIEEVEE
jgi:hypothetical protein